MEINRNLDSDASGNMVDHGLWLEG
jgi:hypothetical protein